MPTDNIIGFIFDSLLNENAAAQIKQCALMLRSLYDASADKIASQWAVLSGVTGLVAAPEHREARLTKTPDILMALYAEPAPRLPTPRHPTAALLGVTIPLAHNPPRRYDIDVLEEAVVLQWHAKVLRKKDDAGKMVREAAAPFIKWLREAKEGSSPESAGEEGEEGALLPFVS